ncbi:MULTISPECIES: NADP-dependent oxidoreductase [Stenotrophomonas]|uniref:NADP-dependent oxidoreductase n=1 Tax=Stenotrophomonas maltophilia TaxID=40324 RepID=A0A431UB92_STEMA|nr:NADP-dependent oxidoreductase [Stenotrophomonas maltophilia]RTQ85825.1 NADP-dependent oxidoreductase [Stenotrophomonas maltophilia]
MLPSQFTMFVARQYGNASVVERLTAKMPKPSVGEVLIEVRAAGINPIDARRMTGEVRHSALPLAFGTEFAGVVRAVGAAAPGFPVGTEVLGSGAGFTHATHILVPSANLIVKPAAMTWEVAGSLAGASQTASTILSTLKLVAGNALLIHGGSGGVGSITVQLARQAGVTVVATSSEDNLAYLAELGAIAVAYGPGLADRIRAVHPMPFDASVDMAGTQEATSVSLALVRADGQIATIAGKPITSARVFPIWVSRDVEELRRVVAGVADGTLRWSVSRTYAFDDAAKAYDDILKGHTRGKSVLLLPQ